MTKQEMLKVVSDHIELGTPIKVVKNGNDDYSVYAVCNDGLVEITPQPEEPETKPTVFDTKDLEEYGELICEAKDPIMDALRKAMKMYNYDSLPEDSPIRKQITKLYEAWEYLNDGLNNISEMLDGNYNVY